MKTDRGLILLIISLTIIVSSYVFYIRDKSVDYTPQGELISDKKIITDENEILKYAEEYDLKDVDDIHSLQIYNYDFKIENEYQEPKKTFIDNIYGPEYYIKEGTVTEPVRMKGNLIISNIYQQDISNKVDTAIKNSCKVNNNIQFSIDDTIYKNYLGYSAYYQFPFTIEYEIEAGISHLHNIKIFNIIERKHFELWESDIFIDDKVGKFQSDKPVGVILVHYVD